MAQCTMFLSGTGDQIHPLPNLEMGLDKMSKTLEKGRKPVWLPPSPSVGGLHETTCTWSIWDIWEIYWEKYLHWNWQSKFWKMCQNFKCLNPLCEFSSQDTCKSHGLQPLVCMIMAGKRNLLKTQKKICLLGKHLLWIFLVLKRIHIDLCCSEFWKSFHL